MILITLYLVAIVAANLLVTQLGPAFSVALAFVCIGPNLTIRDRLHERWQHRNLWRNMALLIGTGSIASALINVDSTQIAIASFIAITGAGVSDTLVYQRLRARHPLVKMNGSNFVSAIVDSILFPAFAFGFPLLVPIMVGQIIAKIVGGAVWSVILMQWQRKVVLGLVR